MKANALEFLMDLLGDFEPADLIPFDAPTLEKLEKLGFDQEMIEDAYAWFYESQEEEEAVEVNPSSSKAMRVYTPLEMSLLSKSCRGLLLKLEQTGVLTTATREIIINQMMQLDIAQMDIEQLKWLSIIALSDHLDNATITRLLDYLLLQEEAGAKMAVN